MGYELKAPTNNDWEQFDKLDNSTKAMYLYSYLGKNKRTMEQVCKDDFGGRITTWDISLVTRCYGFGGTQNGGKLSGYQPEYDDFLDFVESHPNGCDYDVHGSQMLDWFQNRYNNNEMSWQHKNPQVKDDFFTTSISNEYNSLPSVASYNTQSGGVYVNETFIKIIKSIPLIIIAIICIIIGTKIRGCTGISLPSIIKDASKSFVVEQYNYKGNDYIGTRKFNKPNGLNVTRSSDWFTLGDFKGDTVNGYAVMMDADMSIVGQFSKSKPKGYSILRIDNGAIIVAKLNKSYQPNGLAFQYDDGKYSIVKYKSLSDYKTIATLINDEWVDEKKGKPLNLKNNSYKNMRIVDNGVVIDNTTYTISTGKCEYSNKNIKLILETSGTTNATYDSSDNGNKTGVYAYYNFDRDEMHGKNYTVEDDRTYVDEFIMREKTD